MTSYYPFTEKTKKDFGIKKTSGYGPRGGGYHSGIDYAPSKNRDDDIELIASHDGELSVGTDKNGGHWEYIKGTDGKGYLTVHSKKWILKSGTVKAGEVIALMGTTGHSTGVHVHFETRANYGIVTSHIDPESLDLKYYKMGYEQPTDDEWQAVAKWMGDVNRIYDIELLKEVNDQPISREHVMRLLYRYNNYLAKTAHDDKPV